MFWNFMKNRETILQMGEKVLYLLVSAKIYAFIPNRLLSFVACEFEKKFLIFSSTYIPTRTY